MSLDDFLPSDPTPEDADSVDSDLARRLGGRYLPVYTQLPSGEAHSRHTYISRLLEYAIAHDPDDSISHIRKNSIKKVVAEHETVTPQNVYNKIQSLFRNRYPAEKYQDEFEKRLQNIIDEYHARAQHC
jgi:hypothetical protein